MINIPKLGDPRWQGIGAVGGILLSLVAILLPFLADREGTATLHIDSTPAYPILSMLKYLAGLQVSFDGSKADPEKLLARAYRIDNRGTRPIEPDDYAGPLVLKGNKDEMVIAAAVVQADPTLPAVTWELQQRSHVAINPVLLNPNDGFLIIVISEYIGTTPLAISPFGVGLPQPRWTAQIAGAQVNQTSLISELFEPGPFGFFVLYIGTGVYVLLGCASFLMMGLLSSIWLGRAASFQLLLIFKLVLCALLSFAVADTLVGMIYMMTPQHPLSWPPVAFYFGLLLGLPLYRRTRHRHLRS